MGEPNVIQVRQYRLERQAEGIWRIEPIGKMKAGVHIVGSHSLIEGAKNDRSIDQAANVATLPGVVDPVLAMPDIHQGYGFPIGGVAAFKTNIGVISPGGVGYDINCGVRLLKTPLLLDEVNTPDLLKSLVSEIFSAVPSGVGSRRKDLSFSGAELCNVLENGSQWAVKKGFGTKEDSECTEAGGRLLGADPEAVSQRALERGSDQLGTLGSGNHFIEIQYVDKILNSKIADVFGLMEHQVVVMIHTGSRGLGYQVCDDFLHIAMKAAPGYGIELVDRELAAVPLNSKEGQSYFSAMAAAANFAFANRQIITHWVREVFRRRFGNISLSLLYDVCHNIAKIEEIPVRTGSLRVCVHRKGATRAYPAGHPEVPSQFRSAGQPVLVPGDMGRYSFVLAGNRAALERSLGSACHGAGREMSRSEAKRSGNAHEVLRRLEESGVYVRAAGRHTVLEEMPEAYKDVTEVVEATEKSEIATVVARLRPIGVVKG